MMHRHCVASSFGIIFYLTTILLNFVNSQNQEFYINHNCFDNEKYNQGSAYEENLNSLLENLTTQSDSNKFSNATYGEGRDMVYGLFLCHSLFGNDFCNSCIKDARDKILQECPNSLNAIVWYFQCMLRYSNHNIFATNDVFVYYFGGREGLTSYGRFNGQLRGALISISQSIATTLNSSSMSATTIVPVEDNKVNLNPYVECTPDLSLSDCRSCLDTGLNGSRFEKSDYQNGWLVQPSCRLMYQFMEYRNASFPAAPGKQPQQDKEAPDENLVIGLGITSTVAAISLFIIAFLIWLLKRRKVTKKPNGLEEIQSMESLQIEYKAIKIATYNFSEANKLGQGGFGIVYMGTLSDGQAVAVKRLSNASGQGVREFKTEVCLAAKLQHKNLVKVYGFCLEKDEMLLVYEFVPNKSLDRYLFDVKQGAYLKWETRYKIIVGIARGLLYLHEDSSPRIIHRDLKPSNILLDGEMSPKIADFGLAKLFGGDQTQGNTSRIAGTFGYMAPEYVATRHISVKSDIFSYGVILLEIVSGLRNRSLDPISHEENLLKYAWRLWNEGVQLNLVDATLQDNFNRDEIERCIQVGLLCTQEDPAKRPNMSSVLIMLSTRQNFDLPSPDTLPIFSHNHETKANSNGSYEIPIEDVITELSPR